VTILCGSGEHSGRCDFSQNPNHHQVLLSVGAQLSKIFTSPTQNRHLFNNMHHSHTESPLLAPKTLITTTPGSKLLPPIQTKNNKRPTTPTTNNQQPTTNNQQPITNNQQPTANSQRPTTNNQQTTNNNQQQTANN
jgi:hypothetical protein